MKIAKPIVALAIAAVTAAGLSACSGTSQPKDSIPVAFIADIEAPALGFNLRSLQSGAEAAVKAINNAGGVNGHPIKLIVCNTEGNPNTGATCARNAAKENVVAAVGGSAFTGGVVPVLQAAGIADIGALAATPDDFQSPVSFPITGSSISGTMAEVYLADVKLKAKNISVVTTGPGSEQTIGLVKQVASQRGMNVVNAVSLPMGASDLAPSVAAAAANGSQAILLVLPSDIAARFVNAAVQGTKTPVVSGELTPEQFKSLGKAAEGLYVTPNTRPVDAGGAGIDKFVKEMNENDPAASKDSQAVDSWLAMHMFADVAAKLDTITAKTVLEAWNKATDINGYGLIPNLNTSKPFTGLGGAYPRLFNMTAWLAQFSNGKLNLLQDSAVNLVDNK